MLNVRQILVSALPCVLGVGIATVSLTGCGQTGPLFLPNEAAAAQRATLPQILTPSIPGLPGRSTPAPADPAAMPAAGAPQ